MGLSSCKYAVRPERLKERKFPKFVVIYFCFRVPYLCWWFLCTFSLNGTWIRARIMSLCISFRWGRYEDLWESLYLRYLRTCVQAYQQVRGWAQALGKRKASEG